MDITKERLKVNCPQCDKKIILTYHTTSCPKCRGEFHPEEIRKTFHDYESALANNKLYQAGERMGKVGKSMDSAGNTMSQIGCSLIMITLFVIIILMLLF